MGENEGSENNYVLMLKTWRQLSKKVNSAIRWMTWIDHYALDIAIGFPKTYPVDSDLSDG